MLVVNRAMLANAIKAAAACADDKSPVFFGFNRQDCMLFVVATDGIRMAVTEICAKAERDMVGMEQELPDYVAASKRLAHRAALFLDMLAVHEVCVWPYKTIEFDGDGAKLVVRSCCSEDRLPPYAPTLQRFRESIAVSFATETQFLTRAIRNGVRAVKRKAKANGIARAFCIVKLVIDDKAGMFFYPGNDEEAAYYCELPRHNASGAGEILLDASRLDFLNAVEYETVNLSFSSEKGKAKPLMVEYAGVNVAVMGLNPVKSAVA